LFPTLDAHVHLDSTKDQLDGIGAVLAMSLSLDEAERSMDKYNDMICWGVGCHPRRTEAQKSFDLGKFEQIVRRTAVVGEIGLDFGSNYQHASKALQTQVFQSILELLSNYPRIVSIHSYQATEAVLNILKETHVDIPVLHGWYGNVSQTIMAVELGCYFSIHPSIARYTKFRNHVPLDRVLVETDNGYNDPPLGIPSRIEWCEHLVAQQFGITQTELRNVVWRNFSDIVEKTDTIKLLAEGIRKILGCK